MTTKPAQHKQFFGTNPRVSSIGVYLPGSERCIVNKTPAGDRERKRCITQNVRKLKNIVLVCSAAAKRKLVPEMCILIHFTQYLFGH